MIWVWGSESPKVTSAVCNESIEEEKSSETHDSMRQWNVLKNSKLGAGGSYL
jgi:hypothetical protein